MKDKAKPSPTIAVRPAIPDDVPLMLHLIRELARYERLSHEVVASIELLRENLFGPHRYAEALVGLVDDQPVGFALFFHNFSTFLGRPGLYLEDLFVLEPYRGLGLGKRLLGEVAKIAVARNCGRYEWSVLDWNAPAIEFYERLGAKLLPDWRRMQVTGDALVELGKIEL